MFVYHATFLWRYFLNTLHKLTTQQTLTIESNLENPQYSVPRRISISRLSNSNEALVDECERSRRFITGHQALSIIALARRIWQNSFFTWYRTRQTRLINFQQPYFPQEAVFLYLTLCLTTTSVFGVHFHFGTYSKWVCHTHAKDLLLVD